MSIINQHQVIFKAIFRFLGKNIDFFVDFKYNTLVAQNLLNLFS
jgi:hypothetical protein